VTFTDDFLARELAAETANPTLASNLAILKFFDDHADGTPLKATVSTSLSERIQWLVLNP
jgi:hypothetical protein